MSRPLAELRAMSDSEIIDAYDSEAKHVSVGLNYWTDELERRSRERSFADEVCRSVWDPQISVVCDTLSLCLEYQLTAPYWVGLSQTRACP